MRKFVLLSAAAVLAVAAPTTAAYAGGTHGGGGGGGKAPAFTFSVPTSDSFDQSAVQTASITVTRSGALTDINACSSTVKFTTSDGTGAGAAVGNTDYTPVAAGTVQFNPGALTAKASVSLLHETDNNAPHADATEHFTVTISSPASTCKSKKSAIQTNAATDAVSITDGRTVFDVPPGDELQFTNPTFSGCDNLGGRLLITNQLPISLGGNGGAFSCDAETKVNVHWTNGTGQTQIATLELIEGSCPANPSYYSDTTSLSSNSETTLNHALVTPAGTNTWTVALADGGGGGSSCSQWRIPTATDGQNLTGTLTLVTAAPATPTNFTAVAHGPSEMDVNWDPMPTADSYDIYGGSAGDGHYLWTQDAPPFSETTLNPGTNYCYYVVAHNDIGSSAPTTNTCDTTAAS